jgi:hypothetical protein
VHDLAQASWDVHSKDDELSGIRATTSETLRRIIILDKRRDCLMGFPLDFWTQPGRGELGRCLTST